MRQLLYRYIIHARPHLTAKKFRYLKTLIGKAAIDWGFLQNLAYFSQLRKSVNQPTLGRNHTQYFDLSSYAKCFVLIKQSYNTFLCLLFSTKKWLTLSQSYGVNLPSSLMIVNSNAFVYSTSLLGVVSRYGFPLFITNYSCVRVFFQNLSYSIFLYMFF